MAVDATNGTQLCETRQLCPHVNMWANSLTQTQSPGSNKQKSWAGTVCVCMYVCACLCLCVPTELMVRRRGWRDVWELMRGLCHKECGGCKDHLAWPRGTNWHTHTPPHVIITCFHNPPPSALCYNHFFSGAGLKPWEWRLHTVS